MPFKRGKRCTEQLTIREYGEQLIIRLKESLDHAASPRYFESVRGWGPTLAAIVRLFNAAIAVHVISGAENHVLWVNRIYPDRTAIAIIEELPGFATVIRAIESATRRCIDQIRRGGVDFDRVNIRINKWLGWTFERGISITALGEVPCFATIV